MIIRPGGLTPSGVSMDVQVALQRMSEAVANSVSILGCVC